MDKFKITGYGGFHLTIGEYTISVQWKPGNYCSYYNYENYRAPQESYFWESPDAEVAIWDSKENWVTGQIIKKSLKRTTEDDVIGWVTPLEVGKIISWMTRQAEKENKLKQREGD